MSDGSPVAAGERRCRTKYHAPPATATTSASSNAIVPPEPPPSLFFATSFTFVEDVDLSVEVGAEPLGPAEEDVVEPLAFAPAEAWLPAGVGLGGGPIW